MKRIGQSLPGIILVAKVIVGVATVVGAVAAVGMWVRPAFFEPGSGDQETTVREEPLPRPPHGSDPTNDQDSAAPEEAPGVQDPEVATELPGSPGPATEPDEEDSPPAAEGGGSGEGEGPRTDPEPNRPEAGPAGDPPPPAAPTQESEAGRSCDETVVELGDGETCQSNLSGAVVTVTFHQVYGKARPSVTILPAGEKRLREGLIGPADLTFRSRGRDWTLSILTIAPASRTVSFRLAETRAD